MTWIAARMREKVKAKMAEKVKAKMTEKVKGMMQQKVKGMITQKVKAKIVIISPGRSQTHWTSSSVFTPSRRQTRL